MTLKRNHQTAVFVRTPADASANYRERAARFVSSLNHTNTIKADIYSVNDNGTVVSGLSFPGSTPAVSTSEADLRDQAKAVGYVQSVVLAPTAGE